MKLGVSIRVHWIQMIGELWWTVGWVIRGGNTMSKCQRTEEFKSKLCVLLDYVRTTMYNRASAAINPSAIISFDGNFDPLCIDNSFKAAKFGTEPTFENTINDIESNHLKSITYIDINVSAITMNKLSSYSEHLKFNIIPLILLQSPENHHNSPIICIQCTLMEIPNYRFENGGFLFDKYSIFSIFDQTFVGAYQ